MQVHELDVTQYGIVIDLKGNSDLHLSKRRICEKASRLMSSYRNQWRVCMWKLWKTTHEILWWQWHSLWGLACMPVLWWWNPLLGLRTRAWCCWVSMCMKPCFSNPSCGVDVKRHGSMGSWALILCSPWGRVEPSSMAPALLTGWISSTSSFKLSCWLLKIL